MIVVGSELGILEGGEEEAEGAKKTLQKGLIIMMAISKAMRRIKKKMH